MNKLLTLLLSLNIGSVAIAQETNKPQKFSWENKEVQCGAIEDVFEKIKEFGEEPVFVADSLYLNHNGVGARINIYMFYNKKAQTYTLVETNGKNVACLVSFGEGMQFFKQVEESGI